ncbi:hypothetical protein B0H16DRAFT_1456889 [Mycena metata]|uniref:Uncharacterized protein n=1 Tax=Mycena metata TaxID=1033252 RepID=A0AAD7JCE8_9AGAR|nr:hypothetical protein B0H16DRAFT_1456889 [Mycena metata]
MVNQNDRRVNEVRSEAGGGQDKMEWSGNWWTMIDGRHDRVCNDVSGGDGSTIGYPPFAFLALKGLKVRLSRGISKKARRMEGNQKGVHKKKAGNIPEANCNEPEGVKIRSDNRKVKSRVEGIPALLQGKLDDVEVGMECGGEVKKGYGWKGWGEI